MPPGSQLHSALEATVNHLAGQFETIAPQRKIILNQLTRFIQSGVDANKPVRLNFICTHNSRRSHIAQLWAQAAAYVYKIPRIECFSGGTEATAFNPRAVGAMQHAGFQIHTSAGGPNPEYKVTYAEHALPVAAFSKRYNDAPNPQENFAVIMTCSDADQNCPFIAGASVRIALTYDDPKHFDGTSLESQKYQERVHEIGRDILFSFSRVSVKNIIP